MVLEVVVFNYVSALAAASLGADRLELCDNYLEGGTTPSLGMVTLLRNKIDLPLFAMVRPRGGDFFYSDDEFSLIEKEISIFKDVGCDGIVVGCLKLDGTIDYEKLDELVHLAYPMEVTFNRAFDRTRNRLEAIDSIYKAGCHRILTSGGYRTVSEGISELDSILKYAKDRVTIIAGGGLTIESVSDLLSIGVKEFHTPVMKIEKSNMNFVNPNMNENLETIMVDKEEMVKFKRMLHF
jgi:copper homeostasis protein